MITVVFGRPNKSVDVVEYGVSNYKDKDGKSIYKVYGIVQHGQHSRIVKRTEAADAKDVYTDSNEVVIYRSEDENKAKLCKHMIDSVLASGGQVFSVEEYKQDEPKIYAQYSLLEEQKQKEPVDVEYAEPMETVVTADAD